MDLVAITFDSYEEAQRARSEFATMSRDYVVELSDSVIAYKDAKGHVKLDQTVNLTGAGAAHGSFLGLLVGMIVSIPVGGLALPFASALVGAGLGAISGKLSDYGINDDMMRRLADSVEAGKATLFVLARKVGSDRVVNHLRGMEGAVLQTSLPSEWEEKFEAALREGRAA